MRALELKVPPPALALVFAALMWLVAHREPAYAIEVPSRIVLAICLAATGILSAIAGVVTFRRARTTLNPHKPEKSSSMVTWGAYTFTRNPMYLGLLLVLTGWAIFLANTLACLFLPAFIIYIDLFQIAPEERVLAARFGKEFAEYKTHTRRWL